MIFESINPANEQKIASFEADKALELETKLKQSHDSGKAWKNLSISDRNKFIENLARVLRRDSEKLAHLITNEMGKILSEARSEVEKCAFACDYYVAHGESFLAEAEFESSGIKSFVSFQALGCLLGIMPWNFPLWQVIRFAVPALQAGNSILIKPAPNTIGCALALRDCFLESGFPEAVFQNLILDVEDVSKVIRDPRIAALSLTGSAKAGRAVAKIAGESLKKSVLELGGSDPYLLLDDADFEPACKKIVNSRIINAGQSCIAAKRVFVTQKNSEFVRGLILAELNAKKMGDPLLEGMDLGPLARKDLQQQLRTQVQASINAGARLLLGSEPYSGKGYFYPPSLLEMQYLGQPLPDEELFGPVLSLIVVKGEDEMIEAANQSQYGLGAGIFSRDLERAEDMARRSLNVGMCFINDFVKSEPGLPFGGVKNSGYGRELSFFGSQEFVNIKAVKIFA